MSLSNEQPIDFEVDLDALPVVGQLPAGLQGVLVRNGPNPVNPQPGSHWFTGDGMLHAFYFENGNVNYSNRWVRTQHFLAETQDEVHQGKTFRRKWPMVLQTPTLFITLATTWRLKKRIYRLPLISAISVRWDRSRSILQ